MWVREWECEFYCLIILVLSTLQILFSLWKLTVTFKTETTLYTKEKKKTERQLGPALSAETACPSKWSTAGPGSVFHIQHLALGLLRGLWISLCGQYHSESFNQRDERCQSYWLTFISHNISFLSYVWFSIQRPARCFLFTLPISCSLSFSLSLALLLNTQAIFLKMFSGRHREAHVL